MFALILTLFSLSIVLAAGFMAALSDVRGLTIPNRDSIAVAAAFFLAWGAVWLAGPAGFFAPLLSHILAAGLVFLITAVMFAARMIGAADSKLGTAFALWAGLKGLPLFLVAMTMAGGLLGLAALFIMKRKPFRAPAPQSWIGRLQQGQSKVPYGVAIVVGAFVCFLKLGYFDPRLYASFLGP